MSVFKQHDKRTESDRQMLARVGKKFAVLFIVIMMFDTLWEWMLELIDVVVELIHLLIEVIEHFLEVFLEHTLHTNHHQSETIIVNGAIIIALYSLYRLYRAMPRLYMRFKRNSLAAWLRHIRRESSCWRALPLIKKIKLVAAYSIGISTLLFWLTL